MFEIIWVQFQFSNEFGIGPQVQFRSLARPQPKVVPIQLHKWPPFDPILEMGIGFGFGFINMN